NAGTAAMIARATAAALVLLAAATASAQDGSLGITAQTVFPPFNPKAAVCGAPPGLSKTLAFAQDNERQFMQGVSYGLARAARDRGLEYRTALANNDSAKMIEQ